MFKLILVGLLVCSTMATFSVNLERQQFKETTYSSYTYQQAYRTANGGTSYTTKWAVTPNPVIEDADSVFTFETKVGEESQRVLVDTTVSQNWEYQDSQTPAINGQTTVPAGAGRLALSKAEPVTQSLKLHKQTLEEVKFQKSNAALDTTNRDLFSAARYGLALDRRNRENFFGDVTSNINLEPKGQGFSFYFSEKINQLFFGLPQLFFAEQKLEYLDAKSSQNDHQWVLPIQNDGITLKDANQIKISNSYALFDTTTRYIWAPDALVDSIVKELNAAGLNCQDVNQKYAQGLYTCTGEASFPALQIQFRTLDAADGQESRVYTLEDYTEKLENGHRLLIRKSAQYQNKASGATKVPINNLRGNNDLVILGTVFLDNVYTYFNYDNHTIGLAQAYNFTPQTIGLSYTWRLWFLILGTLFTIGAIAAVLAILKKVPYSGIPNTTNVSQVQVQPQAQVSSYIPQQSQVRSSPVYYVAQQQQPVAQTTYSPQRVVYSNYQAGATIPQQQTYFVQGQN